VTFTKVRIIVGLSFLLLLSCKISLYILDSKYRYKICKYFLPLCRLCLHFLDNFVAQNFLIFMKSHSLKKKKKKPC
jgi:hypothetical protein